jgi:hypothetical protein
VSRGQEGGVGSHAQEGTRGMLVNPSDAAPKGAALKDAAALTQTSLESQVRERGQKHGARARPHATIHMSSFHYTCVLCAPSCHYIYVLMPLYICPHATIYVSSTAQILPEEKHKEQTTAAAETEAVDKEAKEAQTKEARPERETQRGEGGAAGEEVIIIEEEDVVFQQYRHRRCQEMKVLFLVFFPSLSPSFRARMIHESESHKWPAGIGTPPLPSSYLYPPNLLCAPCPYHALTTWHFCFFTGRVRAGGTCQRCPVGKGGRWRCGGERDYSGRGSHWGGFLEGTRLCSRRRRR